MWNLYYTSKTVILIKYMIYCLPCIIMNLIVSKIYAASISRDEWNEGWEMYS